ncbi:MAG: xylulokinase [Candidatus Atribacteria bacterium]|nr:xylulokinase [Candidatus Atribacteria bacterium]
MSYLGVDVGTTGCKVIGFDEKGKILASSYREYPLYQPEEGWIELDPKEVEEAVRNCLQEVTQKLGENQPVSIGISSQGEAVVPVDEKGEPLARGIVTFDCRGDEFCPFWREEIGEERFFEITGMTLSGIGTVNKILWWKKYRPEVWNQARFFLCFEDFFAYRMGVQPAISFSLAGRTMMFDVQKESWSEEILSRAEISPSRLAQPLPSGTRLGEVSPAFREEMGWQERVVVAVGGHDQPCGAMGSGVIRPGLAMDATGTVECIAPAMSSLHLSPVMRENNLCCYHHVFSPLYLTMVYNFTGGAILRWFRDTFAQKDLESAQKTGRDVYDLLLSDLPDDPTRLYVLPHFTTTGTPYFDSHSCGVILGLSLETKRNEIIKALLEGVSLEMKFNLSLLTKAGVKVKRLRAIGGGARSKVWLQLKADVYDLPVESLSVSEAACLGASLLGRKAREGIDDLSPLINELVQVEEVYQPREEAVRRYQEKFELYQRIYPALKNQILGGKGLV